MNIFLNEQLRNLQKKMTTICDLEGAQKPDEGNSAQVRIIEDPDKLSTLLGMKPISHGLVLKQGPGNMNQEMVITKKYMSSRTKFKTNWFGCSENVKTSDEDNSLETSIIAFPAYPTSEYKTIKSTIEDKKCSETQKREIFRNLHRELKNLHSMGYYHGDMDIENAMVNNCCVRLIDFGNAGYINTEKYIEPGKVWLTSWQRVEAFTPKGTDLSDLIFSGLEIFFDRQKDHWKNKGYTMGAKDYGGVIWAISNLRIQNAYYPYTPEMVQFVKALIDDRAEDNLEEFWTKANESKPHYLDNITKIPNRRPETSSNTQEATTERRVLSQVKTSNLQSENHWDTEARKHEVDAKNYGVSEDAPLSTAASSTSSSMAMNAHKKEQQKGKKNMLDSYKPRSARGDENPYNTKKRSIGHPPGSDAILYFKHSTKRRRLSRYHTKAQAGKCSRTNVHG